MPRNLTMMTDLYQLTMMYGYFKSGTASCRAAFDLFFRRTVARGYAIVAGLEQAMDYLAALRFEEDDLDYLRSLNLFGEDFLAYLRSLRFTGDVMAMPEGTLAFPGEPILRVCAPIIEAQLVETALLNIVNHQTLIATKAARVAYAAMGDSVLEFGLRRAQGPDAGIYGARAAIIGGCASTSNVLAGKLFSVPISGTHAHSWVMSFESELTAFREYARAFPQKCLLLVDTYDTLNSGVPNAITVFKELRENGFEPMGIRLDSGDLAYLSKKARKLLDDAGFPNAKIVASGDIDETTIQDLKIQGARIDTWGIGTRLITGGDVSALGGVYKLCAKEEGGVFIPKLKLSDNPEKMTNPGVKKVFRMYSHSGKAIADLIALEHEAYADNAPLTIYDPVETWKSMRLSSYTVRELLAPVIKGGEPCYKCPPLSEIQRYAKSELETLWDEYRRLNNPHVYKVDLSDALYNLKKKLLHEQ